MIALPLEIQDITELATRRRVSTEIVLHCVVVAIFSSPEHTDIKSILQVNPQRFSSFSPFFPIEAQLRKQLKQ